MKKFLIVVCIAGLPLACTPIERKGAIEDLGSYVGAPEHPDGSINRDANGNPFFDGLPDYDAREVAIRAAEEVAKRAGTPTSLLLWVAVGGATVAAGWFKRRFLAETVVSVSKAALSGALQKPKIEPEDEEK